VQIWRRQTQSSFNVGSSGNARTLDTYLLIKLDEGGFELLLVISTNVAWVLGVTQTFAHVVLFVHECLIHSSGESIKWNCNIFGISDSLEFNVGDFLVAHDCGIVGWHIAWEFGEIGSHYLLERCK